MSSITEDFGPLDEQAFGVRVEPHRRELHVHCYRLLGSLDGVEDWIDGGFGWEAFGSMRCVVARANGQPGVAGYVRKPGDVPYEPLAIDILRVQDRVVTEIVTFGGAVCEHFDLPATLSAAVGTR